MGRPKSYTQEQEKFMFDTAQGCKSYKELTERFNARFGTDKTECAVKSHVKNVLHIHIIPEKTYSAEQEGFLRDIAPACTSYKELTDRFNRKFGTEATECAIQQHATKNLKLQIRSYKNGQQYTKEQKEWIRENYGRAGSYAELTERFNREFGRDKPLSSVRELCTKRLKLAGMANATQYGKGHKKEQCPIGTLRTSSNSCTYIKVRMLEDTCGISGYKEPYWLPLQKKIWMDHYGDVPEGKMVIFLDGDHENLDISNLYCIDRRISAVMAANRWYTCDREHTLTAIKWCELHYAIKDSKGKENEAI